MTITKEVHTKSLPEKYKAVVGVLREGRENATTTSTIMMLTGIKGKRDVYEIIEQLILKHGYVIGASRTGEHRGYFLITNHKEYTDTMNTRSAHIKSMIKRHKKMGENYFKQGECKNDKSIKGV